MTVIPNASRLCLQSLLVKDSAIFQSSTEFRGLVRFGPESNVNFQGPVCAEELKTDSINEKNSDAGVTVDGVLMKDSNVCANIVQTDMLQGKTDAGVCIDNRNAIKVAVPAQLVAVSMVDQPLLISNIPVWGPPAMFTPLSEAGPAQVNILKSGVYQVYVDLHWGTSAGTYMKLIMKVNNVLTRVACNSPGPGPFVTQSLCFNDNLDAGQWLTFGVEHNDGSVVALNDFRDTCVTVQYVHEQAITIV
jgi:hypothetical protein